MIVCIANDSFDQQNPLNPPPVPASATGVPLVLARSNKLPEKMLRIPLLPAASIGESVAGLSSTIGHKNPPPVCPSKFAGTQRCQILLAITLPLLQLPVLPSGYSQVTPVFVKFMPREMQ